MISNEINITDVGMEPGHKIIIEGIDGSGKSTICNKLQTAYREVGVEYEIVHCTRHTTNDFEGFLKLLASPNNIIFDRFYVGQYIYQTSKERKEKHWMTISDLAYLETVMSLNNCEFYYINTDLDICYQNCLKDRDDSYYSKDYIKSLADKYVYFISHISSLDWNIINNKFSVSVSDNAVEKSCDYRSIPKTVAVDFDGCLVLGAKFPEIGKINERLRYELFEGVFKDYKKILWTSRSGQSLIDAITFCQDNGMYFDKYNENLDEAKQLTGNDTRKIFADYYLDDKAIPIGEVKDNPFYTYSTEDVSK